MGRRRGRKETSSDRVSADSGSREKREASGALLTGSGRLVTPSARSRLRPLRAYLRLRGFRGDLPEKSPVTVPCGLDAPGGASGISSASDCSAGWP